MGVVAPVGRCAESGQNAFAIPLLQRVHGLSRSYTLLVKLSWQTPDLNKSTLCCLGSLMLSGWAFGEEVPIGARE